MYSRRKFLSGAAALGATLSLPGPAAAKSNSKTSVFTYCLNTSTISGQNAGIINYVDIAAAAGYDAVEVWVRDVKSYVDAGQTPESLKKYIAGKGLTVANAIGFAPWISGGDAGMRQMEEEMELLASIGCHRIAAPAAGVPADQPLDLWATGEKYRKLLDLGRKTGVMPQLEFWGASPVLWHLGQALMIAAVANDTDARILTDVYHLYRGGSGFNGLSLLGGGAIDIMHLNDYPASIPRTTLTDADRVYPGDGIAPWKQILTDLKNMGGHKILSLELFNKEYWKLDPLAVAKTGLQKMKTLIKSIE